MSPPIPGTQNDPATQARVETLWRQAKDPKSSQDLPRMSLDNSLWVSDWKWFEANAAVGKE